VNKFVAALVLASLCLAACGTQSVASAMQNWVKQSAFRQNLPVLLKDVRISATQLRSTGPAGNNLHTVCAVLDVDTESANASLPTPDTQATNLLSKAYNDFGSGANRCYDANSSVSARAAALAWLSRGVAELSEATARINVATGHAP
jgi:hypothetical protein